MQLSYINVATSGKITNTYEIQNKRKKEIYFICNDVKNLTYILPPLNFVIWHGGAKSLSKNLPNKMKHFCVSFVKRIDDKYL